jgi:tetratricopeptide (TPR) repeat protein
MANAAFLGMLTLRAAALGGLRGATDATFFDNPAAGLPALARAATALSIQARYLSIFSWPSRLSSDYSYDAVPVVHGAVDWRLAAGVAFALGIGTLLVLGWKRSRTMCLCAAIWTLFFLPASNLLFPAGTLMAERLAYLPSLGACLLLGHLGARFASSDDAAGRRWRAAGVIGVGAIAVLVLSARTWARTPEWRDNATLALADVETYPRSAKLQAGAGIVLHEAGKPAEAETHYRSALAIYPDYAQVRYNLGELLSDRGEKIEAVQQLIRAAVLSPQNPRPLQAIAKVIVEPGPDARRIYEEVLAEKGLPDVVRREASSRLEALEAGAPR